MATGFSYVLIPAYMLGQKTGFWQYLIYTGICFFSAIARFENPSKVMGLGFRVQGVARSPTWRVMGILGIIILLIGVINLFTKS